VIKSDERLKISVGASISEAILHLGSPDTVALRLLILKIKHFEDENRRLKQMFADQSWSVDFMRYALVRSRRFRMFNVVDRFNREALSIEIDLNRQPSESSVYSTGSRQTAIIRPCFVWITARIYLRHWLNGLRNMQ
jgi:hypothetical protein